MISAPSRELWLTEQAKALPHGSDDQLSWLLTASTLYPGNLEANIQLFRVLRSQKKSAVAAVLLSKLIAKFSSSELVLAEMKSLAEDADEERHSLLIATSSSDELEKIDQDHQLATAIIGKLPPDIQAVVRLKAVSSNGVNNLSKRADILCSALSESFSSGVPLSDAFATHVCSDILDRLLASPSRELRACLCEKIFPALFHTKTADPMPHPLVSRLSSSLVFRCLCVYVGHVLLTAFNSSTASVVSIDRQWLPCLTLVNRVLFNSLNIPVPAVFSDDDGVDPQAPQSLDQLTNYLLNLQDRFVESMVGDKESACDVLALMTAIGLLRNLTSYLRSLMFPSEGENVRAALMPSLSVLYRKMSDPNPDIVWAGAEDSALSSNLSSAFNVWSYLLSIQPSSRCILLPRRIHEIFGEISTYYDDEDPLRLLDQFRVETFIYKGAFDQALNFFDPKTSLKSLLVQRVMCLTACGRIKEAARLILESNMAGAETGEDDLDFTSYIGTSCYLFTPVSAANVTQIAISVLRKSLESLWPVKEGAPSIVPSAILVLHQVDKWPTNIKLAADIITWLYNNTPKSSANPQEMVSQSRLQSLLQTISPCVFRPELLELLLHLTAVSAKQASSTDGMETEQSAEIASALPTMTKALQAQLANVSVAALTDPNAFALNFIRSNVQAILSVIPE